jgi:hypothetical protein
MSLLVASACIVAGFVAVFARDDWPHCVYVTAYGVTAVALVLLGAVWRVHALWAFALAYLAGCIVWRLFLWQDDPQLTGMDDISPIGGYLVTVPFALVLIGIGWAGSGAADGLRGLLGRSKPSPGA